MAIFLLRCFCFSACSRASLFCSSSAIRFSSAMRASSAMRFSSAIRFSSAMRASSAWMSAIFFLQISICSSASFQPGMDSNRRIADSYPVTVLLVIFDLPFARIASLRAISAFSRQVSARVAESLCSGTALNCSAAALNSFSVTALSIAFFARVKRD